MRFSFQPNNRDLVPSMRRAHTYELADAKESVVENDHGKTYEIIMIETESFAKMQKGAKSALNSVAHNHK